MAESLRTLRLGEGVSDLKRSVMRDLLALAVDPEIISLAGGLPASELLPVEALSQCLTAVLERDGARALQYSPPDDRLRAWIAGYMSRRGVRCGPEEVFITNGAQQGLAILSRLFLDRGKTAVIEQVTFTGIQQVTAGRGARVVTIPTDLSSGADLAALEAALHSRPTPRLVILVPDFHNPLGVSLSSEKRARAAALAEKFGVPLLEDDPYAAIRFSGEESPPIKAYDEAGFVFYLGSFSKMLAPAMRLGWIVARPDLIPKITVLRESIDLETSSLTQRAVAEFLARGLLEPHLRRLSNENGIRCGALQDALRQELGGLASWTKPDGGIFLWLTLPEEVDTWEMFPDAVREKVAYLPGSAFTLDGSHANCMRLNFSNARPEAIRVAVARLAEVIRARLA
jgi:2-aminoadipate transaminase